MSSGCGRPVCVLQNLQLRVQMSPPIIKVAVPFPQHSPILGQRPLLHIVCKQWESTIRLVSVYRSLAPILIFSHSGLRTLSVIISYSRKSWSTVCIGVGGYCHRIFHDCGSCTLAYQIVFQVEPIVRHILHSFGSAHCHLPCHAPTTSFHVLPSCISRPTPDVLANTYNCLCADSCNMRIP